MTASKSKKGRHRKDGSLSDEIKQDNVEAARKQQSKKRTDLTNQESEDYQSTALPFPELLLL